MKPTSDPEGLPLVRIPAGGGVALEGNLGGVDESAGGLVLFAHGSGSSRFSPRNRRVARMLREGRLATLLIDLLTPEEEAVDRVTARLRFDIRLLARRLVAVTDWLLADPRTHRLRTGYFGSSTGAAAALVAAAARHEAVGAVVSRGGRPDLAGDALPRVRAPTLLIVGGHDHPVIEMNREAFARLRAEAALEIVPGATHLFEEAGALDAVARLARGWFERHLVPAPRPAAAAPQGRFRSRREAGERLAGRIAGLSGERPPPVVLVCSAGAARVAAPVARTLGAPLDAVVTARVAAPGRAEATLGAVGPGEATFLDLGVARALGISARAVEAEVTRCSAELLDRMYRLRGDRSLPTLEDRVVLVVDDGATSGAELRAALSFIREHRPRRIVVALPVATADARDALRAERAELVCLAPVDTLEPGADPFLEREAPGDAELAAALEGARHEDATVTDGWSAADERAERAAEERRPPREAGPPVGS
jgi:predicted phosphoribosyltransferase/dienelactone hydrolase